jgi:hypothetical protein
MEPLSSAVSGGRASAGRAGFLEKLARSIVATVLRRFLHQADLLTLQVAERNALRGTGDRQVTDATPSDGTVSAATKHFIEEFVDKDLVDFAKCRAHYERMTPDELVNETSFLGSPQTTAVSFVFSGARYHAFFSSVSLAAGNVRALTDRERALLINIAIHIRDHIRERTAEPNRAESEKAFAATLELVRVYGLFPKVGDLIANGVTNYDGTFETAVVGEALEKKPNGEFVLSGREVAERAFVADPEPTDDDTPDHDVTADESPASVPRHLRNIAVDVPSAKEFADLRSDAIESEMRGLFPHDWDEAKLKAALNECRYSAYYRLVTTMVKAAEAHAIATKMPELAYSSLLGDARSVCSDLRSALRDPSRKPDDQPFRVWEHVSFQAFVPMISKGEFPFITQQSAI